MPLPPQSLLHRLKEKEWPIADFEMKYFVEVMLNLFSAHNHDRLRPFFAVRMLDDGEMKIPRIMKLWSVELFPSARAEQALAADGAIACFSMSCSVRLNGDREPQLKARR